MSNEVKRAIPARLRELADSLMPAMHGDKTKALLCRRAADEIKRITRERDALSADLDSARVLLGMMASALYEERNDHEDTPAHILNATNAYEMWLAATPAPEAQADQGERQEQPQ